MPFGAHKGKSVAKISRSDLRWLKRNIKLDGSLAVAVDKVLGLVVDAPPGANADKPRFDPDQPGEQWWRM
jgi:hypothetical protein